MSEQLIIKTFNAGGAIKPYRLVEINAAGTKVTQANSNADNIIGVALPTSKDYASGDRIDIGILGIFDIEAGVALNAGVKFTTDSDGKAAVAASGKSVAGIVLEKAAVGDIVRAVITPSNY